MSETSDNKNEVKKEDKEDIRAKSLLTVNEPIEDSNEPRARSFLIVNESKMGLLEPQGETPAQIHKIYNFDRCAMGKGQTIAIICAFDYPTARNDLDVFSKQYRLPKANLEIVYARGVQPPLDEGWALESALDIEWAHAMAPKAKIILVLAASNLFSDLFQAVDIAVAQGADVISMSWGGGEFPGETFWDYHLQHEGVTFVAGSGDVGGQNSYPSTSQYVLSVGGTRINRDSSGKFVSETAWIESGGGQSLFEPMPAWQTTFGLDEISGAYRATPDVAFDADPASGVSVYTTTPFNGYAGWGVLGGTSVGGPCLAGIIACINEQRIKPSLAGIIACIMGHRIKAMNNASKLFYWAAGRTSYKNPYCCFRDITSGTAGTYSAGPGYDFVTGLGSPNIKKLVRMLRFVRER